MTTPISFGIRSRSRKTKAPVRLQIGSLEDRVVFNAAVLGPLTEAVAIVPTTTETADTPTTPLEHFAGCGCGECRKLVLTDEDGTERIAYAISPPAYDVEERDEIGAEPAPPFPGQTFTLHSRPSATKKIYLDFNGHVTAGTSWNSGSNGGQPFTSGAFDMDGSPGTFNLAEEERIQRIWQRIMEDYSPFDVDVTTEDPGIAGLTYSGSGDNTWGMRVVITPDDAWIADTAGSIGGIAFVPSFRNATDITCYVFSDNLGNGEKSITEAASHEVGHTLGLGHDGTATQGYYGGHAGAGTPGWAPIMGVGYYQPMSQWSRGEYASANNSQDDLNIITNTTQNFGYRPDDAGNTIATATAANVVNGSALTAAGVVERTTDVDVYSFLTGPGNVSFSFDPYVNSPNLDIRAELRDSAGTILAFHDPLDVITADITYTIPSAGTYYLFLSGVGVGNAGSTGYSDYGSLGQYTITGTVIPYYRLTGMESANLIYTENQAPVALTANLAVSAGPNINQAIITIQNYVNGQDVLAFTNQSGISGNYNTGTGVLTLTGTATAAQYQTALRSIRYSNSSEDPSTITRSFVFQVRDINSVTSNNEVRTMTLLSVNDSPTLSAIGNRNLTEDAPTQTVNLTGIGTGGETQTLTIIAVSNNPAIVPNPTVTYSSPNATGSLAFTPVANAHGSVTITVTVRDNGGTANGGVNQRVRTFTINLTPDANDAPLLDNSGNPNFTAIPKNETAPVGDPLTLIIDESITDPDPTPLEGIAVIGLGGTANGTWEYSLDGTTWVPFGNVDDANARLLRPTDLMRFIPTTDFVGVVSVTYRAWDQFTGTAGGTVDLSVGGTTGGATAYSTATETANYYVAMGLTPVAEDYKKSKGDTSQGLLTAFFDDPDPNAKRGMAITSVSGPTNGIWQYSSNGRSWKTISNVSASRALLLKETDRVRFLAAQDQYGYATVRYHAWDQTMGKRGTYVDLTQPGATGGNSAFSSTDMMAFARTTPTNDRPILDKGGDAKLTLVAPNSTSPVGDTVADILGSHAVDPDVNAAQGMAITGLGRKPNGQWQYSTDAGATWQNIPTVSARSALLLREIDKVRFVPNAGFIGTATFTFKAWDQTEGIYNTLVNTTLRTALAYSTITDTATVTIDTLAFANRAPVLNNSLTPTLATLTEDVKPKGEQVAALLFLGTAALDPDIGAEKGVAIVGLTGQNQGRWEYSLNGRSWKPMGNVSSSMALLLRDTDYLRYVPNANSTTGASITYHAWDRTRGTSGGRADLTVPNSTGTDTPFSIASETATVTVTAVNDAPTLNNSGQPVLPPSESLDPAGVTVASFANSLISDPDAGAVKGIALTKLQADFGNWEYSADDGATWELVPVFPFLTDKGALLLQPTDRLRLKPFVGTGGLASLNFKAWDQTAGLPYTVTSTLGSSAFSKESETIIMGYNNGNDRPLLNTTLNPIVPHPNGTTVANLVGSTITDPDIIDPIGIAITYALSHPKKGTWEFSADNGSTWIAMGKVSTAKALLLTGTDMLRFVPAPGFTGTMKLMYKAWDQSLGTAGGYERASASAFSLATETAYVNINTAPTLLL